MKIYIVEDNKSILDSIHDCVSEYVLKHHITCDINTYNSDFESILDDIETDPSQNNIYFFDIMLSDTVNGLRLAQKIRKKDIYGYIVFITSHVEFAFPAIQYKIRALDYILKGDKEFKKKVFQCLDTITQEISEKRKNKSADTIVIRTNGTDFLLSLADIIYFETNTVKRSIIVHSKDKTLEFRDSLDNLEKRLGDTFYRCHRSYIINTKHIESISRTRNDPHVMLAGGFKCLISPRALRGLLRYDRDNT